MSLYNDYQAFTAKTAIYPAQIAAEYLTLGLCSEAAECADLIRSCVNNIEALGAELSDVQWYVARLCATYDFAFQQLVDDAKKLYEGYAPDVMYLLNRLTVESGLIAGKVKKQLRDGHLWTGEQREDARYYIRSHLIQIVILSMQLCDWMYRQGNVKFGRYDNVLAYNRDKLEARAARGTLRGDGDNR